MNEADLAEASVHSHPGRMTEGVEVEGRQSQTHRTQRTRQSQTHRTQRTRQSQTQGDTVLLRRGSGGEAPQGPEGPEARAEVYGGSEVRAEGSGGTEDVVETRTSQGGPG
ncbi:unnamed protein product [Coregonus sp. 'balchen']|nr:unnamed protein product [Coregonus sp. 'balchen']